MQHLRQRNDQHLVNGPHLAASDDHHRKRNHCTKSSLHDAFICTFNYLDVV